MPLLPTTLITNLLGLDDPSPPKNPAETGEKWFAAWWPYISSSVMFTPAVTGFESAVKAVFVPILAAGSLPVPVPLPFFLALEGAMRASLALLGTPATLLPAFVTIIPSPVPFAPLGVTIVPVGLASPVKQPPRILLATLIDVWTRTNLVQPLAPGPPVPLS